jgi:arylsulfatase A-like enzyme
MRSALDVVRSSAVAGLVGGFLVFAVEAADRVVTLWPSFNSAAEPLVFALYLAPVVFLGLAAGLVVGPSLALLGGVARLVRRPLATRFGRLALVAPHLVFAGAAAAATAGALAFALQRYPGLSLRRIGLTLSLYFLDANAYLLSSLMATVANWMFTALVAGAFVAALAIAAAPSMVEPAATPAGARARRAAAVVAALCLVGLYAFDSRFEYARYDGFVHLPAAVLQSVTAFLVAAIVLRGRAWTVSRAAAERAALAIFAFGLLASGLVVYHIGSNENLKALLWRRSVVARRVYEAAVALTDRDGDGFSAFLAGPDTNDRDPAVNPLATEIPGNGVDDNGIGGDAAAAPPAHPPTPAGAANGKRVVLIAIDTLRADRMSLYGYERPTTPRIDEHAKSGLVYEACYSQGTNTAVAFSAMQTSASRGGVFESGRTRLFPRLKAAGYATGQVNAVLEDIWLRAKASSRPYRRVILDGIDNFPHELGDDFWDADRVTDAAIEYLSSLPADAPSATWVHYFDPHTPRRKMAPFDFGDSASDKYDSEVAFSDREVGRLLDWMRSSGFMKDTIVILTADHGEAFLEHGMDFHGNRPYGDQIHIPLVVWTPELPPGRTAAPASIIDVAPTVYEFLGLAPAPDAEGRSLLAPIPADRAIFAETPLNIVDGPFNAFAVTQNGWKLIHDVVGNTTELYDLERDPAELRNLADAEPERVAALRALLGRWLDETRSVTTAEQARRLLDE